MIGRLPEAVGRADFRIRTDGDIRNSANASGLQIVYVTDPWGTKIEITEGLVATPLVAP